MAAHNDLLLAAVKALRAVARPAVIAQERVDYWQQFGTHTPTCQRAEAKLIMLLTRLEHAEAMADAAIRGNVTLFNEAQTAYHAVK